MSGSEIRLSICKSAPRSRQITTPAPHHSVFYRPNALPAAQPTASKHWREQALKATFLSWSHSKMSLKLQILVVKHRSAATSSVCLVWSLQHTAMTKLNELPLTLGCRAYCQLIPSVTNFAAKHLQKYGLTCLWQRTGDLSLLDTHAVVSCNNENFSDIDPQTTKLFDRAGPELHQELINSIRGAAC